MRIENIIPMVTRKDGTEYSKGWNDLKYQVSGINIYGELEEEKALLAMSEVHSGTIKEAREIIKVLNEKKVIRVFSDKEK